MHDALDIDDRVRLQLVDLFDDFAEFVIVVLGIGNSEFIDTDRNIDLAELRLFEQVFECAFCGFLSPGGILHLLIVIEQIIDRRRLPGKEGSHIRHITVFIQAHCPGITDHKRVRKIAVVHFLQAVIGPVGCKKSLFIRIVDCVVRREVGLVRHTVVLCPYNLAAGTLRDRERNRLRGLCRDLWTF